MVVHNRVKLAGDLIESIHSGVKDSYGQPLISHLNKAADEVSRFSTSVYKTEQYIAALLRESGNADCIAKGQRALNLSYIEKVFGRKVSFILGEIREAPKGEKLKMLSLEAQEVIMADSLVSLGNNPDAGLEVLSVLKGSNPALYSEAEKRLNGTKKSILPSVSLSKIKNILHR